MKRAVSFNGYNRENNKDWTGFSGSVRAGGGYEADWGTIKAGPFAALDYAFSSRPSLTEDNGMGSRLHLDSETFHLLRSSLGVRMSTNERRLTPPPRGTTNCSTRRARCTPHSWKRPTLASPTL